MTTFESVVTPLLAKSPPQHNIKRDCQLKNLFGRVKSIWASHDDWVVDNLTYIEMLNSSIAFFAKEALPLISLSLLSLTQTYSHTHFLIFFLSISFSNEFSVSGVLMAHIIILVFMWLYSSWYYLVQVYRRKTVIGMSAIGQKSQFRRIPSRKLRSWQMVDARFLSHWCLWDTSRTGMKFPWDNGNSLTMRHRSN